MELRSDAFDDGGPIPTLYAREGREESPPLTWSGVPGEAEALALLCEDPDAPSEEPFAHWVVFNIPPETEGMRKGGPVPGIEGVNDFHECGYGGPMPPPGDGPHAYRFRLFALDETLSLRSGAHRRDLLQAVEGHTLSEATLTGTYEIQEGNPG